MVSDILLSCCAVCLCDHRYCDVDEMFSNELFVLFTQALSSFVQRCYEVIKHVFQQLSALYISSK